VRFEVIAAATTLAGESLAPCVGGAPNTKTGHLSMAISGAVRGTSTSSPG
jgi:hypothetical protein